MVGIMKDTAVAELVLECVHADGVALDSFPILKRAIVLRMMDASSSAASLPTSSGNGTARVGRQYQVDFFRTFVPRQDIHNAISRAHFELVVSGSSGSITLRLLSPSPYIKMWADGCSVVQGLHPAPLTNGSELGFSSFSTSGTAQPRCFLVFRLEVRTMAEVRAEGSFGASPQKPRLSGLSAQQPTPQQQAANPVALTVRGAAPVSSAAAPTSAPTNNGRSSATLPSNVRLSGGGPVAGQRRRASPTPPPPKTGRCRSPSPAAPQASAGRSTSPPCTPHESPARGFRHSATSPMLVFNPPPLTTTTQREAQPGRPARGSAPALGAATPPVSDGKCGFIQGGYSQIPPSPSSCHYASQPQTLPEYQPPSRPSGIAGRASSPVSGVVVRLSSPARRASAEAMAIAEASGIARGMMRRRTPSKSVALLGQGRPPSLTRSLSPTAHRRSGSLGRSTGPVGRVVTRSSIVGASVGGRGSGRGGGCGSSRGRGIPVTRLKSLEENPHEELTIDALPSSHIDEARKAFEAALSALEEIEVAREAKRKLREQMVDERIAAFEERILQEMETKNNRAMQRVRGRCKDDRLRQEERERQQVLNAEACEEEMEAQLERSVKELDEREKELQEELRRLDEADKENRHFDKVLRKQMGTILDLEAHRRKEEIVSNFANPGAYARAVKSFQDELAVHEARERPAQDARERSLQKEMDRLETEQQALLAVITPRALRDVLAQYGVSDIRLI